jgi:hypothetical protein
MPYALCPMPYALCPMPYALCPMPYARLSSVYLMLLRKAISVSPIAATLPSVITRNLYSASFSLTTFRPAITAFISSH